MGLFYIPLILSTEIVRKSENFIPNSIDETKNDTDLEVNNNYCTTHSQLANLQLLGLQYYLTRA